MEIKIGTNICLGNSRPLAVIAGPCAIESRDHALWAAEKIKVITSRLGIGLIYKSSFDKANRSSISTYRGMGMEKGLSILQEVRSTFEIPVLTDIHLPEQADPVAEVVDMLQIPAFLCRQTDLIIAAARTGKPVNIKKGQFMAPEDMRSVADKAKTTGNNQVCLCERGTFFGYHNLVVDMRSLAIMKRNDLPVIFDATHSVQLPGGNGMCSSGEREFVFPLARAAVTFGIAAIFMETHENPEKAPCDGPNMIPLDSLSGILASLIELDRLIKGL